MDNQTKKIINFLREIEKFKFIKREIYNSNFKKETDAEHVWHMIMFAILFENNLKNKINILKAIKMTLIHDLVEIYSGDIFAYDKTELKDLKQKKELEAADKLFSQLPEDIQKELFELWKEYEEAKTKEAIFVKSIDRLQALNQNILSKGKIWWDYNIKYNEVLNYKKNLLIMMNF